ERATHDGVRPVVARKVSLYGDDVRGRRNAAKLARGLFQPLSAPRTQHDSTAFGGKGLRTGQPESPAGAGDDGGLPGELEIHGTCRLLEAPRDSGLGTSDPSTSSGSSRAKSTDD